MSLTPDEIAGKEFLVGLRGYDKDEVRSFLRTVADAFRTRSTDRAPEPEAQPQPAAAPVAEAPKADWNNLGDEIAAVLRTAHDQAAGLKAEAEAEAKAVREQAEADAARRTAEADAHAETVRAEAEQDRTEAAAKLTAAQEEALGLVAGAQSRVDQMIETSRRKAEEEAAASVRHLTDQVAQLTTTRDAAKSQLTDLRTRVEKALAVADRPEPGPSDSDD